MIQLLSKEEEIPYDLLLLADETIEAINRCIFQSDIYVLRRSNEIIAVYVLIGIDNETVEIKYIAVRQDFQGQGIGQELLKDAVVRAKEMGFKKILIETADAGIKQLYIYQKAGFVVYDKKTNFFLENFPEPIFEDGIQLIDMIMLKMEIG